MEKKIFTGNTYPFRLLSVLLLAGAALAWFRPDASVVPFGEQSVYFFPFFSILCAYILSILPPPTIEIDETGIKRLNNAGGWISMILRPDSECRWEWITSVSTYRTSNIDYATTVLMVSSDTPYKSKYLVSFESNLFKDYVEILNIIKAKVPQVNFDKNTESVLEGRTNVFAVKPYHYAIVILIFIAVLALLVYFNIL
jgi:hypothetical protein